MTGLPTESSLRNELDGIEGGVTDTPIEGVLPRENAVDVARGLIVMLSNDEGEPRAEVGPDSEDIEELYERGFALAPLAGDEWHSPDYSTVRVVDADTV